VKRDKAHCLNHTVALIWKYCDGTTGVREISNLVGDETQTLVDDRIVLLALDQLEKFELLDPSPTKPDFLAGMNRRQLVRQIGTAALALPMILSIATPTPAQTASQCACVTPNCRPQNCLCSNPGDCANPLSCQGPPAGPKTCQP